MRYLARAHSCAHPVFSQNHRAKQKRNDYAALQDCRSYRYLRSPSCEHHNRPGSHPTENFGLDLILVAPVALLMLPLQKLAEAEVHLSSQFGV